MDIRLPDNREEMKRVLTILFALNLLAIALLLFMTASGVGPLFDMLATPQNVITHEETVLYYNGTLPLYP